MLCVAVYQKSAPLVLESVFYVFISVPIGHVIGYLLSKEAVESFLKHFSRILQENNFNVKLFDIKINSGWMVTAIVFSLFAVFGAAITPMRRAAKVSVVGISISVIIAL